jgi:hypothetical protein
MIGSPINSVLKRFFLITGKVRDIEVGHSSPTKLNNLVYFLGSGPVVAVATIHLLLALPIGTTSCISFQTKPSQAWLEQFRSVWVKTG